MSPFLSLFVGGAGVLALWIDTSFPKLAPESFSRRVVAACVAIAVLELVPLVASSTPAMYATMFGAVLPALVCTLLTAIWLLRTLRDARAGV
jgi:hypothetical protein